MNKNLIWVGAFLILMSVPFIAVGIWLPQNSEQHKLFALSVLLVLVPTLLLVVVTWQKQLERAGFYGVKRLERSQATTASNGKAISTASAVGATIGAAAVAYASHLFGLSQQKFLLIGAGAISGMLVPIGSAALIAAFATYIRWSARSA